ncbi:hypothetical protein J3Q64DRAFT_1709234 [Phycomyces blakesleeanus]|uniref:DUF4112 domain-containing protein n=2 Tax=Phycomyces blakesleeanus TaxID=4837 RepID=A0A162NCL0_PHYB8|nr:hypothetical protein PHYBLDRAFT_69188 [Phycomyces blakesleeanus NRRL 1555(-)]OAD68114.1 hypothetical protein PHYBLDRAFT_69188 [Phycomyces blakesleeanus NRRL 1555(-)]|eukprot:XP_018286154.1 hypothetical protein PHYBLDRAFT_69188 [Phycomyces blakesleeanus NRRL 1555(-)]
MMKNLAYSYMGVNEKMEQIRLKGTAKITSIEIRYPYLHYTTPHKPLSTEQKTKKLGNIKQIAHWLDSAVPGSPIPLGLDPFLSLIPFIGGFLGSLFAMYQIYLSTQFGIPLWLLLRMLLNVFIDFMLGMIPVAGSFLDMFYKANLWNAEALEDWLNNPEPILDPVTGKTTTMSTQITWSQLSNDATRLFNSYFSATTKPVKKQ